MIGLAQFIVLFAGPIGLALLAAFVVVRWVMRSRRGRSRETPQLEVVPASAAHDAEKPAQETPPAQRPSLRVVSPRSAARQREGR